LRKALARESSRTLASARAGLHQEGATSSLNVPATKVAVFA
jgi:hypothetical protein